MTSSAPRTLFDPPGKLLDYNSRDELLSCYSTVFITREKREQRRVIELPWGDGQKHATHEFNRSFLRAHLAELPSAASDTWRFYCGES